MARTLLPYFQVSHLGGGKMTFFKDVMTPVVGTTWLTKAGPNCVSDFFIVAASKKGGETVQNS